MGKTEERPTFLVGGNIAGRSSQSKGACYSRREVQFRMWGRRAKHAQVYCFMKGTVERALGTGNDNIRWEVSGP